MLIIIVEGLALKSDAFIVFHNPSTQALFDKPHIPYEARWETSRAINMGRYHTINLEGTPGSQVL